MSAAVRPSGCVVLKTLGGCRQDQLPAVITAATSAGQPGGSVCAMPHHVLVPLALLRQLLLLLLTVCPPGTFGPACQMCLAGSYCPGGAGPASKGAAPAPIVKCPDHMTSQPGSVSESSCVCMPGFGGQSCTKCEAGTYSEGGSRKDCLRCSPGQTSIEGAPSKDYCHCAIGESNTCSACPASTWSEGGFCRACADGKTSDIGATSPNDCCKSVAAKRLASPAATLSLRMLQDTRCADVMASCLLSARG